MSGPSRPAGRPSRAAAPSSAGGSAAAAPAPHNTGAGSSNPSLITISQTESASGQGPSSWHYQMAFATTVLRTLNGMMQEEVQRQRSGQQASSTAGEGARSGHFPPSMQQHRLANMEVINALCYEIEVLFPIIVSNYPLAGPRPTAPLVEGLGTDAISTVYASRIETVLRRHSDQPRMLETFQQQLQAVLHIHTHNISLNASHDHLIRELRQLIQEENERGQPGVGRRQQTNPSQSAQGLTNVLRAARDVQPAARGETAALREMIRDFGETGVGVEWQLRAVAADSAETDELIRQTRMSGGTATLRSARSDQSPPHNRGGRSQNISDRERGRSSQSPSSGDSSGGNSGGSNGSDYSGEVVLVARGLTPAESAEWDRQRAALTAASTGRATTPQSAARGRTGSNTNTRGAHVPGAARGSGPAQGGNPQGGGTSNGHGSQGGGTSNGHESQGGGTNNGHGSPSQHRGSSRRS
jgi:hypothetical protein